MTHTFNVLRCNDQDKIASHDTNETIKRRIWAVSNLVTTTALNVNYNNSYHFIKKYICKIGK